MNSLLNKTKSQLEKDWELAAKSSNYRNTIAQKFTTEELFRGSGQSQTKAILKFLNKHNVNIKNKIIVEIGCGVGRVTEFLAKEAKVIYATDISKTMLKRFKERLGDIKNVLLLHAGDLRGIETESVDIILSFLVFQHNPEDVVEEFLKDGYRALKPSGHFVFQLTIADTHQIIKSKFRATDMVRWTKDELQTLASKYGYEPINPVGSWLNIWRKI